MFLSHFLILLTCILNLTKPCAYLIKISLFQPKIFKRKSNNRKIAIILDRVSGGGRRDIEITNKFSKQVPNIFFLRRSIVKMIFFHPKHHRNTYDDTRESQKAQFFIGVFANYHWDEMWGEGEGELRLRGPAPLGFSSLSSAPTLRFSKS